MPSRKAMTKKQESPSPSIVSEDDEYDLLGFSDDENDGTCASLAAKTYMQSILDCHITCQKPPDPAPNPADDASPIPRANNKRGSKAAMKNAKAPPTNKKLKKVHKECQDDIEDAFNTLYHER